MWSRLVASPRRGSGDYSALFPSGTLGKCLVVVDPARFGKCEEGRNVGRWLRTKGPTARLEEEEWEL
jgi:hypothetical protein